MKTLSVGDFKTHFSEALVDVKNGQPVGVCYGRKGKLVAVLVPPSALEPQAQRRLGALEGRATFEIKSDFPMTDEELLAS